MDQVGHQHTIDRHTGKVGVFDGDVIQIDVYETGVAKIGIGKRRSLHIHIIKAEQWSLGVVDLYTGKVGVFDADVTQIDVYQTSVAKIDVGKRRSLHLHIVKARLSQVRIAYNKCLMAVCYFHRYLHLSARMSFAFLLRDPSSDLHKDEKGAARSLKILRTDTQEQRRIYRCTGRRKHLGRRAPRV
jgi:hypothetical protein